MPHRCSYCRLTFNKASGRNEHQKAQHAAAMVAQERRVAAKVAKRDKHWGTPCRPYWDPFYFPSFGLMEAAAATALSARLTGIR